MPRTCTICRHKKRDEIEAALARRESLRHIASQFSCGYKAVERHQYCIQETLREARKANDLQYALNVDEELKRCFVRANRFLDACDDYLIDPEDPSRYTLDSRAGDISVIYNESDAEGKPQRKRAKLSALLRRIEKGLKSNGVAIQAVEAKHADPRELLLKAVGQLSSQIDILAKLRGDYQKKRRNELEESIRRERFYLVIQERYRRTGVVKTIEEVAQECEREMAELADIERELDLAQDFGRIG